MGSAVAVILQHLRYHRQTAVTPAARWVGFLAALSACVALVYNAARPDPLFLLRVPPVVLLLAVAALAVAVACTGQFYVHRRFKEQDFVQHNEVGGFMIAVMGSMYGVVLGFLTVAAWQNFNDAQQLVAFESAAASDAWHMAVDLPDGRRSRVRSDILAYANLMARDEWLQMRIGGFDTQGDRLVMDAMSATEGFRPADLGQSNAQSATMQQLGVLHDVRSRRLAANASGLSGFEWLVLVIGAACVICFCWLFGLSNRRVHLIMTAAVTIVITSTLVLLFELQYPFRSAIGIGPDEWNAVIAHIHVMLQAGSQPDMRM